jgi:hypothetical protein
MFLACSILKTPCLSSCRSSPANQTYKFEAYHDNESSYQCLLLSSFPFFLLAEIATAIVIWVLYPKLSGFITGPLHPALSFRRQIPHWGIDSGTVQLYTWDIPLFSLWLSVACKWEETRKRLLWVILEFLLCTTIFLCRITLLTVSYSVSISLARLRWPEPCQRACLLDRIGCSLAIGCIITNTSQHLLRFPIWDAGHRIRKLHKHE